MKQERCQVRNIDESPAPQLQFPAMMMGGSDKLMQGVNAFRKLARLAPLLLLLFFSLSACGSAESLPQTEDIIPLSTPKEVAPVSAPSEEESTEGGSFQQVPLPVVPRPITFPTSEPQPDLGWRPPPYPAPWSIQPQDHFYFIRPIPSGEVNWPNPSYRYGSTLNGEETIHTGIDIGAERGTPVLATGDGEVVWAGYGLYRGIYDETDPYGLAVAIRHDFGYEGQPVYTVYAHMESVIVWKGQPVKTGEHIGMVGETGHASGAHLHYEVRIGENRYFSTRNPELWIVPPDGWGVLVGRVENTYRRLLEEQLVQIHSLETGQRWDVWTYATGTVHSDEFYGENFVISDLPAGPYEIRIDFAGHPMTAQFWLHPGKTNYFTFKGRQGFIVQPTPTPVNLASPPS